MKCIRCDATLQEEHEHGNRKRCPACSLKHKRQSNRQRQQVIRLIGNAGLRNYRILVQLNHRYQGEISQRFTIEDLVKMNFSFNYGFVNISNHKPDNTYTNCIQIIGFQLLFNANKPDIPVKIIQTNHHE